MKVDALWINELNKIGVAPAYINDEPDFNEVQVEIKGCGICAWDCALFSGKTVPGPMPFMHGHEGIGYVTKVGKGVKDLEVGQLVFCVEDAPQMIQVQNIKRDAVTPIRTEVKDKDIPLWVAEPMVCVVNTLGNIKIKPASNVVLIGAGYMGLLLVQALQKCLIGQLSVFDLDENRLALAKKFGADKVYVSGTTKANEAVNNIKEAGGAELVIECSGAESGLELANQMMAQSGTLNLFSWHRGERTINMTPWHQRGYRVYNTAPNFDRHFKDHLPETEVLLRKGVFNQQELITHIESYKNAQSIMEIATSKNDNYIKGVILFD